MLSIGPTGPEKKWTDLFLSEATLNLVTISITLGVLVFAIGLLRHLWRMFFPMYVATSSLFSGQQQVFPEALQGTIYLELPHTLVPILLVFWLGKVSLGDRIAKRKRQRSTASEAA